VLQFEEEEAHFRNRCPSCKAFIEAEFAICPNCLTSLKLLCQTCNQQLKRGWKVCPYCKAPVSEETVEPMRMLPEQAETAAGEVGVTSLPEQRNNPDRRAMPRKTSDRRILVPGVAGQAAVGKSGEEEAPSKKPKILIVDDDPSIRTILERSLEQLPFAIETELASNGAEGVERAGTMQPDLIILDIMMPGMDGFEVCEKLRSQVETAFIPIMMLTASPSEEGRIRGYMVGTDDYVSKPFNVAELNARLTRLLRRTYGVS
ncbi:MAG: response regulator, partial [Acidobacteria bacterium]|nr:response regulator [Acidobacteriota bacterium]